ncbi:MAG: ABC transporter ATP-binding protein [Maricaulaceae bacterium]
MTEPRQSEPLVAEARDVVTRFGDHTVHDGASLAVRRGEILGLVGGSGTGKSVLLNTILGLRRPQSGEVFLFGEPLFGAGKAGQVALQSRTGVLFQGGALFSSLTVKENVQVPLREHLRLPNKLLDEIADLKIVLSGLPLNAANKFPSELSGGMRKRAGLARALALDPELLCLDEPTAGLDPVGAAEFDRLLRELADTLELSVIMVTHDLDSLHAVCDRVAVLADRKVIATAPIPDLLTLGHPWIDEYFSGPRGRAAARAAS